MDVHQKTYNDNEEDKEDNDEKSENFGCSLMQQKFSLTPITEPNVMTHGTLLWLIGNLHDDDNAKYGDCDFCFQAKSHHNKYQQF